MSNPWKSNILDRSLDDLAVENSKYRKSGQFKKDQKREEELAKRAAAAKKRAEMEAKREERTVESIAVQERSVTGRIDLSQYINEEKLKEALGKFGTVETCKFRFSVKNILFEAKFENKEGAEKCTAEDKVTLEVGDVDVTASPVPVRGRSIYFRCPFAEEERGDELNGKIKGLFESMSSDEKKHTVVSVEVRHGFFSVMFESRESVKAALSGFFEPLMLNDKKLGPVREGLPSKNAPQQQKRKATNDNNGQRSGKKSNKKRRR